MALDVNVKIDLIKPSGKISFGCPCILSIGEEKAYTECATLADVVTAGFEATSDTYKVASMMFGQSNPPAKVAVCGVADASDLTALDGKNWRQLVIAGEAGENLSAVKTYVEGTEGKQLFVTVDETTGLSALGTSDKVVGFVHTNPLAVSALVGEASGREVGSFTYKNLKLSGIEAMDFNDTEISAIHTAHGITYVTKAGDNVTTEGTAMSGEYIDIVDSKDYVIQQLEYQTQSLLNNVGKVPYDNNGIAMLESVAKNVMRDCYGKGIIATNADGSPAFTVSYEKAENVSASDKATRQYLGGKFSFVLAGAIHNAEISGEIIVG